MARVFRLRPVQRWAKDWIRNVQVIFSQVLGSSVNLAYPETIPCSLSEPPLPNFLSVSRQPLFI